MLDCPPLSPPPRNAHALSILRRRRYARGRFPAGRRRRPDPPPSREELAGRLSTRLEAADGYEAIVNAARRWASEENFSVSAQLLVDLIGPADAARRFTLVAEVALAAMLRIAREEAERQYGTIDGAIVIIALGRLGGRAMTAASDVDLMFVYDAPEGARASGAQGLDAVTYYARLVRRFLAAVATPSEEGVLYEVDMQLRPSGAKGPAAVSLSAFRRYYEIEAWTWELMALTRARVVAGDAALSRKVDAEIAAILARPREKAKIAADVEDMRERLTAAKPSLGAFDLKNAVGGFVEVDFTVQYLILTHPDRMKPRAGDETAQSIAALKAAGALAPEAAAKLSAASNFAASASAAARS